MSDVVCHIIVRGRVQGVGYRAWLEGEAVTRGLAGWARNRSDGTVEAVLSGAEDAVSALIARCHQGPGLARVTAIDSAPSSTEMLNLRRGEETFSVLPTV